MRRWRPAFRHLVRQRLHEIPISSLSAPLASRTSGDESDPIEKENGVSSDHDSIELPAGIPGSGRAGEPPVTDVPVAGWPERFSLRVVQFGALAVVLFATPYKIFDLDRFFVPKELILHLTAVVALLFALRAVMRIAFTKIDLLLGGWLLLSATSALFATNRWLGLRALAITASSIALYWIARSLREAGLAAPLVAALALAVVVAAITSLMQAYGFEPQIFSLNRAPGGTLGNRNFIGHIAAFGLPLLLFTNLHASRFRSILFSSIGTALVCAALVLTRSRAAWLAAVAAGVVMIGAVLTSPALRRRGRTWLRLAGILILAGGGVVAALRLPNDLHWRSDDPYLESVRGVVSYDEGSGRGRLIQYEHSLRMAAHHPLLGVGPGNWPVVYPEYAARHDPSLNSSEPGTTYNPWPSSDWVSWISDRGVAAVVMLLVALVMIALAALRRIARSEEMEEALLGMVCLATLTGAVVTGAFDAVLLLAPPALLAWTALGATGAPPVVESRRSGRVFRPLALAAVILISGAGVARSTAQIIGMSIYAGPHSRASLERASRIDPGNYRIQVRLARSGSHDSRCRHARAAHALLPNADEGRALARRCGT
ncbi:MAG: O-antigen ligase family protein [Thermoanaerobaculia bacterium]